VGTPWAIPAFFVCPKWPIRVEQDDERWHKDAFSSRKLAEKNQVAGQREEIDAFVMRM
jgi:hypothetical protein